MEPEPWGNRDHDHGQDVIQPDIELHQLLIITANSDLEILICVHLQIKKNRTATDLAILPIFLASSARIDVRLLKFTAVRTHNFNGIPHFFRLLPTDLEVEPCAHENRIHSLANEFSDPLSPLNALIA